MRDVERKRLRLENPCKRFTHHFIPLAANTSIPITYFSQYSHLFQSKRSILLSLHLPWKHLQHKLLRDLEVSSVSIARNELSRVCQFHAHFDYPKRSYPRINLDFLGFRFLLNTFVIPTALLCSNGSIQFRPGRPHFHLTKFSSIDKCVMFITTIFYIWYDTGSSPAFCCPAVSPECLTKLQTARSR